MNFLLSVIRSFVNEKRLIYLTMDKKIKNMIIMKNIANYITLTRILLSVLLLFTKALSFTFFIIFIICGITDILDGYIARNYGLSSDFGAKLDSFADIVFFLSFLIVLLPVLSFNYLIFYWIIIIFLIKITSIIIGFIKFGKLAMIHTYLNKITGMFIIILPFLLLLISSNVIILSLCLIATLASIEELIINIRSKELILNCNSILNFK